MKSYMCGKKETRKGKNKLQKLIEQLSNKLQIHKHNNINII